MGAMHAREIAIASGMTETSPVTFPSAADDPVPLRVATLGRVQPHGEATVVDRAARPPARVGGGAGRSAPTTARAHLAPSALPRPLRSIPAGAPSRFIAPRIRAAGEPRMRRRGQKAPRLQS